MLQTSNPKLDTAKYYGDLATLLDRVKKAFLRDVHSAVSTHPLPVVVMTTTSRCDDSMLVVWSSSSSQGAVTPISLDYVAPSLARALK